MHGVEPAKTVRRYNRKEKRYVGVKCPRLITVDNKNMGGVYLCDMLLAFCRNDMKTNKWYKRIIFHLIEPVCGQRVDTVWWRENDVTAQVQTCSGNWSH